MKPTSVRFYVEVIKEFRSTGRGRQTIIAGSRAITDYQHLTDAIQQCPFEITSVVSGKAKGVDSLGEQYAIQNNLPVYEFPADWQKYGRGAGIIRNREMAKNAEALLALWDGKSKGTEAMIKLAEHAGIQIFIFTINQAN